MKIRTQFIGSMISFGIILLIIAASVIITYREVDRLSRQQEIAKKIERGASQLSYLSNDYLLYHEGHQHARWETKFASLSADTANLQPEDPEQQTLAGNIKANQQRLKAVFTDVVSTIGKSAPGEVADPALLQMSWSRMAVQNQGMAFDAARLSQLLHNRAEQVKQTNLTLIFALLAALGCYFFVNYLIVYKRALQSIADLQEGTRVIGSGNFDFAIEQMRDDEIGELSLAFNRMTASLKEVTTSKTELEREIIERQRAEDSLRKSEQRWATTLSSIGDAVIASDDGGRITFMNGVAETLTGWTVAEASTKPVSEVFQIINQTASQVVDIQVHRLHDEGVTGGPANHKILLRKDGREVPIDNSEATIRDGDGNIMGTVLVFRDITEQKRAEEELRASNEELESFNRVAVGRELRMIELKKEINSLRALAGQPPQYPIAHENELP